MEKRLKAAVIGCGGAGIWIHIPWYAAHHEVELVGLVDTNITQAEKCAQKYGGRPYDNLTEMLDKEKPDMVSVATPPHLHAQHTIECLQHGCNVLCEKPMAPTLEECQKMIDCAKTNKVILGMSFDKRFSMVFQKMYEVILSGQIGRPLSIKANWDANCMGLQGSFRAKLCTGGGVFQDAGSHFIDLLSWLVDSEISIVEGEIDICLPDILEVEDNAAAILKFKSGIIGTIETSWIGGHDFSGSPYHNEWVWVYGTDGIVKGEGSIRLEPPPVELFDRKTCQWQVLRLHNVNSATLEHYQCKRLVDEFISCVLEKKQFVPSGEEGKKAIEGVLGLYQSSHTGQKVSLPLSRSPNLSEIFTDLRKKSLKRKT